MGMLRFSLAWCLGIFLTWLASILAPFLVTNPRFPGKETTIFGFALSASSGLMAYIAVRICFALERGGE